MNNIKFTYIYLSKITLYQPRLLHLTDDNHKDQAIEAGKNPKNGTHPSGSQGGRSPALTPLFAAMCRQSGGSTISSFRPPLPCSTTPFHAASTGDWGVLLSTPQPQVGPNYLLLSPPTPQRRGIGFFPPAAATAATGTVVARVWGKRTQARWGE